MLQLGDVQVFLGIHAAGSFTAAARGLGIPKSSVTRQLARLEDQIGSALFRRTSRTVELTEAGARFLPHARRLVDDAIEAQKVMQGEGSAQGMLRISASATFGARFSAPLLPRFRALHPRLKVHLSLNPFRADVGSGEGKVDVAIRIGSAATAGLGQHKLGEIDFWIVGSPDYLAGRPPVQEPSDLVLHDLVGLYPRHDDDHFQLVSPSRSLAIIWSPAILIDDPEAVKRSVLAGGGLASLPSFVVRDAVEQGSLVRVLEGWTGGSATINAVYALRPTPPLRVRLFLDFLQDALEPQLR